MDSATGIFLSVLRTHFNGCFQKLNKNTYLCMITSSDAKTPESSKICRTVVAFTYLVSLNSFFILSMGKFYVLLKNFLYKKIHKTPRLYGFLVKISLLRNFINAICDVTCSEVFITLVNLCYKRVSACQGYNGPIKNDGLPFPPRYNLRTATKMRGEYFKDRKKLMSGPSNVYFHVFHENLFTFPFACVQRRMMTFQMDIDKLHCDAFKSMSDIHKNN